MKKTVLIAFALVALAFASCKKDEVIVPEQTTDSRLYGDWVFTQIEYPSGNIQITIEPWSFTEDSLTTPFNTFEYVANGSRLIVAQVDTFNYTFDEREHLVLTDVYGNNLRCRR